jgi:dihydrofolate reductase
MSPALDVERIIALIAAMDQQRAIGRDGGLPWHLPDEMRYFRRTTMGKPVIMGRKTYDTIGKPLAGRTNIILTRNQDYQAPGCRVVHNMADALTAALQAGHEAEEIIVGGGATIYAAFLPLAQRMYLTFVETVVPGADTFFPAYDPQEWQETGREHHPADPRHPYAFDCVTLDRK